LSKAVASHTISSFVLPTLLWPRPEAQKANRPTAAWMAGQAEALRQAALTCGFSTNALVLSDAILGVWNRAAHSEGVFWPTNELSQWILQRVVARDSDSLYAMGAIYPLPNTSAGAAAQWAKSLPQDQTWLTGWQPLSGELLRVMTSRVPAMLAGVVVLLTICLRLASGVGSRWPLGSQRWP